MSSKSFYQSSQRGLSIIELMVALLISSLLTLGLVQIFTSNSQTSRTNEASARVQESGRLSTDIMARLIRNAAYWGCVEHARIDVMLNDDVGFDIASLLTGITLVPNVAAGNEWGAVPGTDVLVLGGVSTDAALRTTQQTPVNSATIFTGVDPEDFGFRDEDLVLISDCKSADLFQISNLRTNGFTVNTGKSTFPGNARQNQNEYPLGASVFMPSSSALFVRENNGERSFAFRSTVVRDIAGSTIGDLGGVEELVSGVRDMRVRLGLRAGADGDDRARVGQWVTALGAGDTEQDVIAVQVSFLARAPQDNIVAQPQSLCFPAWLDCEGNPSLMTQMPDNRLYRVFNVTSGIRSRMP